MIRVGFTFNLGDHAWLGGVNYFRNLFAAILTLPERQIEPVILIGGDGPRQVLKDFPPLTTIQELAFSAASRWPRLRRATYRCIGRDIVIDATLWRNGISVLSHSHRLGLGSGLPAISWIPDFQHVHLPEFFSREEIEARDKAHAEIAATSNVVLLSSRDAQQDFCRRYPRWASKSRVLSFVADVPNEGEIPSPGQLAQRYGIGGPYFLIANQFWAHKNHRLVIDALRVLKERGLTVTVLATGNSLDHRWPGHFEGLMQYAETQGVRDSLRVLGVTPRADLIGLMKNCVALLNPSLFEGWNTGIEEAKTLGIRIIASDIAVHREQAAPGALYVHPRRPEELADAMAVLWAAPVPRPRPDAAASFLQRRNAFARAYQDIVLELCAWHQKALIGIAVLLGKKRILP